MNTRSRIAVVEDDADGRVALGRVLSAGGFDVSSYARAEDYLAAGAIEPLCLVLDMRLEETSGLSLLRSLRTKGSSLPVIIITATEDSHSRYEAERLGCVAYLRKPFQGRAVVEILRALARARQTAE
jgi:FixJ family two-component response regulator